MPKKARELTHAAVRSLKHPTGVGVPVFVAVGGVAGLHLQITANGSKSWTLRTTIGGKRRSMGLGSFEHITLADARDLAREAKVQIAKDKDPIRERKAARARLAAEVSKPTFAQTAARWAKANPHEFTSKGYRKDWIGSMTTFEALKRLHDSQLDQIDDRLIWSVLEPVAARAPDRAHRYRGRIAIVFRWAGGERLFTGENPGDTDWLKSKVKAALKGVKQQHQPALQIEDAPRWWAELRQREGMGSRALEFLALTGVRSGDVRGAIWDEIDLGKAVWTIPAARLKIKNKGEHTVPLSADALALLEALPRMEGNDLVFPAMRGGMMSDMTISATMKRMHKSDLEAGGPGFVDPKVRIHKKDADGILIRDKDYEPVDFGPTPAVPHGLRSTLRDWAGENGFNREYAELALAHVFGNATERAYRRSLYTEQRRPMMEAWAGFLAGRTTDENVVPLHGAGG